MQLQIDPLIQEKCPSLRLGVLSAEVKLSKEAPLLWQLMETTLQEKAKRPLEAIRDLPPIAASRKAYKALGKAPSRYRLSAEALHRRAVQGKGLYRINNVVDIINQISLQTAFSIGGYNAAAIQGDIVLSLGKADEPYEAIGRGQLNIENLPVFRDEIGAFGSPTSDSVRTSITLEAHQVLLIYLDFGRDSTLPEALALGKELLETYAEGKVVRSEILSGT